MVCLQEPVVNKPFGSPGGLGVEAQTALIICRDFPLIYFCCLSCWMRFMGAVFLGLHLSAWCDDRVRRKKLNHLAEYFSIQLNYCIKTRIIKVLGILSSVKMVFTSPAPPLTLGVGECQDRWHGIIAVVGGSQVFPCLSRMFVCLSHDCLPPAKVNKHKWIPLFAVLVPPEVMLKMLCGRSWRRCSP